MKLGSGMGPRERANVLSCISIIHMLCGCHHYIQRPTFDSNIASCLRVAFLQSHVVYCFDNTLLTQQDVRGEFLWELRASVGQHRPNLGPLSLDGLVTQLPPIAIRAPLGAEFLEKPLWSGIIICIWRIWPNNCSRDWIKRITPSARTSHLAWVIEG